MNRNLSTLAIAIFALGLGGVAVAGDDNGVHTTTGADSSSTQHSNAHNRFNELDSNKDGKLSKSELETSDKQGKWGDKWSSIDSNKDGSIDQTEYNRFKATHKDKGLQNTTIRDGNIDAQDTTGTNQR